MADKKKSDKNGKKIFSFTLNLSWIYLLLFLGIGYMLFRNQGSSEPAKIEWEEVQEMIHSGDIQEIVFVRNDFKGEIKVRPERLAKYTDKFRGGIPPRRAPHFYFLVSTKFDPENTFGELNGQLEAQDRFKVVIKNQEHIWGDILQMILPLLILVLFWVILFRGMNRGAGGGPGTEASTRSIPASPLHVKLKKET